MFLNKEERVSYRYMRVFVFFDLPRYTAEEVRQANNFRKRLVKDGFLMLQESVYCKLALNQTAVDAIKLRIKKYLPECGNVMLLVVTEKQYSAMEICLSACENNVLDSDKKLIIL